MVGSNEAPKESEITDGRVARSAAQQEAIQMALIDLVVDGNFTPTAVDVAEKTGINRRTVFRHFSNIEALYAKISVKIRELAFADMPETIAPGPWESRIEQIVVRRRVVFEALLNSLEFMIVNRHRSPYVRSSYQDILAESDAYLKSALQGTVDQRNHRFKALCTLFSPANWRTLRMEHDLSADQAQKILITHALALYPNPDHKQS